MLFIIILALLAFFAYLGWSKGVIRMAVSLVSLIVTFLAAVIVAPAITYSLRTTTTIDDKIADSIYATIEKNENVDKAFADSDMVVEIETEEVDADTHQQNLIKKVGEEMNFPTSVMDSISKISPDDIKEISEKYATATVKEITLRLFAKKIANIILSAIVYIVVMIIVFVGLRILLVFTGIFSKLPIIKQADRLAGVAIGLVEGIIGVWIFFMIITAMSGNEFAANCLMQIGDNKFLSFLYNNNLIMKVLMGTIK